MQVIDAIFQIAILIFSVIIHEVSHGYMALALGDKTAEYEGRLTLNPLKHIDPFGSVILPFLTYVTGGVVFGWAKPVPYNPYNLKNPRSGQALIAAAGPLSNIAIAIFFSVLIRIFFTGALTPFMQIASLIVLVNLVLAIFNLIPIPPLDGSKILFFLIPPQFREYQSFFERNSIYLLLFFIFFLWGYVTPLVGFIFSLFTGIAF